MSHNMPIIPRRVGGIDPTSLAYCHPQFPSLGSQAFPPPAFDSFIFAHCKNWSQRKPRNKATAFPSRLVVGACSGEPGEDFKTWRIRISDCKERSLGNESTASGRTTFHTTMGNVHASPAITGNNGSEFQAQKSTKNEGLTMATALDTGPVFHCEMWFASGLAPSWVRG